MAVMFINLDFSANCNPLGTPQSVKQAIIDSVEDLSDYPRVGCGPLKEAIADYEHTKKEYLICGNGAADLIFSLSRALNPKKALLPAPTFAEYEQALVSVGCEISRHYLKEENDFCIQKDYPDVLKREKPDIIFLCNPNNPTGAVYPKEILEQIVQIARACFPVLAAFIYNAAASISTASTPIFRQFTSRLESL